MGKLLGVVTARGGSKGIPNKNIRIVADRPLMFYSWYSAVKSGVFDRIVISTDSDQIAEIGRELGMDVPFIRPAELAQDDTKHLPVVQHAVEELKKNGYTTEYTAIIQPTSPLLRAVDFEFAYEKLKQSKADSILGVLPMDFKYHPWKALIQNKHGILEHDEEKRTTPRQDLPRAFYSTASIYMFRTEVIKNNTLYGKKVVPLIMDHTLAVDINTEKDIKEAERILKLWYN